MYSSKRVTAFQLPEDTLEVNSELRKLEKLLKWIPADRQEKINIKSDYCLLDTKTAVDEIKMKNGVITDEAKTALENALTPLLRYIHAMETVSRNTKQVKAEIIVLKEVADNIIPRLLNIYLANNKRNRHSFK